MLSTMWVYVVCHVVKYVGVESLSLCKVAKTQAELAKQSKNATQLCIHVVEALHTDKRIRTYTMPKPDSSPAAG